jgi:hypothetical protein
MLISPVFTRHIAAEIPPFSAKADCPAVYCYPCSNRSGSILSAFTRSVMSFHLPRLKSLLCVGVPLLALFAVLAAAPQPPTTQVPDSVAHLARERVQVADRGYELALKLYQQGQNSFSLVAEWARRQAQAHLDLAEGKAERVAFLVGYVQQLRDAEQLTRNRMNAGMVTPLDLLEAQFIRLEGEVWLARAREQ